VIISNFISNFPKQTSNNMISGVHLIICSKNAEADKAFFRDVLKLSHVDVRDGWLIFGLPPAELAVHPSPDDDQHENLFDVRQHKRVR
jgi:hypothetical protein